MKKILLGLALVALVVLGIVLVQDRGTENVDTSQQVSQSVQIIAGDTDISVTPTGGTLLELMQSAQAEGKLALEGKEYTGMGFFASKVGTLEGTDSQFLMYSINGVEASVGVSGYVPKAGDVIEWELKTAY